MILSSSRGTSGLRRTGATGRLSRMAFSKVARLSPRMGSVERISNLDGIRKQAFNLERRSPNEVAQWRAIYVLQHKERRSIVFFDTVYGANTRVVQRGGRMSFALKTGQGNRIPGDRF